MVLFVGKTSRLYSAKIEDYSVDNTSHFQRYDDAGIADVPCYNGCAYIQWLTALCSFPTVLKCSVMAVSALKLFSAISAYNVMVRVTNACSVDFISIAALHDDKALASTGHK